jgi:hypothetical protein
MLKGWSIILAVHSLKPIRFLNLSRTPGRLRNYPGLPVLIDASDKEVPRRGKREESLFLRIA